LVGGDGSNSEASVGRAESSKATTVPSSSQAGVYGSSKAEATPEERKRQLAQLAALGVAVPDQFKKEHAMIGEWKTVERTITPQKSDDSYLPSSQAMGVRKRKFDEGEDEEIVEMAGRRKGWGQSFKSLPDQDDEDVDALFAAVTTKKEEDEDKTLNVKSEDENVKQEDHDETQDKDEAASKPAIPMIKKEESSSEIMALSTAPDIPLEDSTSTATVKSEVNENGNVLPANDDPAAGIIFKKRKRMVVPK
jgi:hypothetical protein